MAKTAPKPPTQSDKKALQEAKQQEQLLSTKIRKEMVLKALRGSMGVVTAACESTGVSRDTYYEWLKNDPAFKKKVDQMDDVALDFTESKLLKNIEKGDAQSIIFHLKTKGRKRGYGDRQDIDLTSKGETITPTTDLSKLSYEQLQSLLHKGPAKKGNRAGDKKA